MSISLCTHRTVVVATVVLFITLFSSSSVFAVTNHVVISEVQISGEVSTDEFVELYNPTNAPINLNGWRLSKKTQSGSLSNLATTISGTIPAHGYFLIAHEGFNATPEPDQFFNTGTVAPDNTLLLYSDAGSTLVDKVGLGDAEDNETTAVFNPPSNGSAERKALSTSTKESMETGGVDEFFGNGEDTDHNQNDFVTRTFSQPQNSSSATETVPTATPTPTPEPTNQPTSQPTSSPTPTSSTEPKILLFRNKFQTLLQKLKQQVQTSNQ